MRRTDAARTQPSRHRLANRHVVALGLVPAAVLAGSLGATTVAGASGSQSVVGTAKIAGLGTVLVASHRPLYEMASDPKGHTTCTGACTTIWKPLIVSHKQAHHLGRVSGLGTIHRPNGQLQAAIHGHALYFFAGDHTQSQAGGQAFANNWFTVHPNGTLDRAVSSGTIVTVPPTSSSPSSSTTTRPTSTTTRPTSAPASPTSPAPTMPPPTSPPTTSPPPPTTTTTVPPTTTTTTSGGGGGVGF
jgi:predicted lipoprotein with Yx(FWY)xxD motif